MADKFRVIKLTKGYCAIISTEDFRRVNRYRWHVHFSAGNKKKPGQPYARACIKGKKVYLHRFIKGAPAEKHVDHRNHQTLDDRRENLKIECPKINSQRRRKPGKC